MSGSEQALKIVAERPAPASATGAGAEAVRPVFLADRAEPVPQPRAGLLAELALHREAETPLAVGIFGGAGTGKSSLLEATAATLTSLGRAAGEAGSATPFLADAAVLRLVVEPGSDPSVSLLRQAYAQLAPIAPALAAGALSVGGDPQAEVHEAGDRLSATRHKLDEERRRLDDLAGRQSRLPETVLFEASGSRVEAYGRANRGRIDRALRRFGFPGDTTAIYKELVRDAAEPGLGRGLGWMSAFWAYRGQLRLLLVAAGFFIAAWLVGTLAQHAAPLLDALRASNDKVGPTADWLSDHVGWLEPLRQVLVLAGIAALGTNALRALRFIQPIARGATLLRGDLDTRRHELDGLLAHQAQRVEALSRDVEQASARLGDAERRLAAVPHRALPNLPGMGGAAAGTEAAVGFFAALSAALVARAEDGRVEAGRPSRLVVTLDGFEAAAPAEAAAALQAAHRCLARPGIVTLLAADRDHLATGIAEADPALAQATLDRLVQISLRLERGHDAPWPDGRRLARSLLQLDGPAGGAASGHEARQSRLDRPWLPKELAVVEALAPFAGSTPRAVKRFLNLYHVARADPALEGAGVADFAGLALGLALGGQGSMPLEAMPRGAFGGDFQAARHAASTALGVALDLGREGRGFDVARLYASA